jgi:hypothetical protein
MTVFLSLLRMWMVLMATAVATIQYILAIKWWRVLVVGGPVHILGRSALLTAGLSRHSHHWRRHKQSFSHHHQYINNQLTCHQVLKVAVVIHNRTAYTHRRPYNVHFLLTIITQHTSSTMDTHQLGRRHMVCYITTIRHISTTLMLHLHTMVGTAVTNISSNNNSLEVEVDVTVKSAAGTGTLEQK